GGVDHLSDPADRAALATFLTSIDASTDPFPLTVPVPGNVLPADRAVAASGGAKAPELSLKVTGPNPFRAAVALEYVLPRSTRADLEIYDLQGRRWASIARGVQAAGAHPVAWSGRSDRGALAPAGVYLARLSTGDGVRVARIVRDR